jgi:hypothetical protein
MNRIYKRIWNAARGCWVVVSEAAGIGQTRGCGKKAVAAAVVCLMAGMSGGAWATGGVTPEPVDTDLPDPDKPEDFSTKWSGDFTPEMNNIYLTGPKRIEVKYENEKTKLFSGPLPSSLKGMHLQAHQSLVNLGSTYGIAGNFENKGRYYTGSQTLSNSDHEHASGTTELLDASYPGTFDNYGTVFSGANGFKVGYGCFINEARGVIKAIAWPNNDAYSFILTGKGRLTNAGRITTSEDEILPNTPIKNASAFLQSGGELDNVNGGVLEAIGGTTSQGGPAYTLTEGVLTNEAGGSIVVVAGGTSFLNGSTGKFDTDAGVGFKFEGGTINNKGQIDINQSGNPMNLAFVQTGGELRNSGILNSKGGNEYFAYGYSLLGGTLTNTADGIINAVGKVGEADTVGSDKLKEFAAINVSSIFDNYGTVNAMGKGYGSGMLIDIGGVLNNHGRLTVDGGQVPFQGAGLFVVGKLNNYGIACSSSGNGRGVIVDGGEVTNYGSMTTIGDATEQYGNGERLGLLLPNAGAGFTIYAGKFTNKSGSSLTTTGGDTPLSYGFLIEDSSIFVNEDGAEVIAIARARGVAGFNNQGQFINAGKLTLQATKALTAFQGNNLKQAESSASISGNLLSFADYQAVATDYVASIGASDTSAFLEVTSDGGIKQLASFLGSGISGGTIHITDTDLSASAQQTIKDAIYGTGVGSGVNITFGGTGNQGFEGKKKVIDIAHARNFQKTAANVGAILYQDDLADTTAMRVGSGSSDLDSIGFRSVNSKAVSIAGGKALTLLGDGTKLAGDATGSVTIADGTLNLGYQHELTKSQKQGGVLGNVSLAKTGVMSVAAVDGLYEIGEKLTLAENAKVKNAGKLVINTLSLTGKNTSIRNDGTMTVSAVDGSSSNRTTVQNTGVLSVDSTKNLSIQNKGTVVANEVSIGALDRVENGGTLVADKFKSNGVLINRGNGQLVIGIVAKVSYLTKHLEVAKEMYDAGETLPEAVIEALKSAGMIPADAAANVAALMMLTDDDRALPDEEVALAADEGEGDAPAAEESSEASETSETSSASETNAPVRTLEDLIRESRERAAREAALVHRTIPTTVGALTSAARGAASQTMATIESQANATVAGLWADAGYGKTEFDAYRTDRSGLLFGVQGSTETLTLGAVLSAGTGNVKSDNLASQDWNDVGGSVYGAYRFGPAALTASALYERHEGKAQGQRRHADVLGASAKVSVDAMLGGMTVTPYAGWRVLGLDHEDAANRVVVHELPVGIKAVGSFEAGSWRISPSADVAYVPTFGDKKIRIDGTNTKSVVAGDNAMTYRVGISAEKNRLSLGLSYVGTTGDCGLRGHSVRGNLRFAF